MGRYWKLLGEYDAESTAYAQVLGTTSGAKSPFTPTENARLVGLRTQVSMIAVTSVVTHVQFKLTCSTFNPNSIEVYAQGPGLMTAPCPVAPYTDFAIDQEVKAGVPITIEARTAGAYASVTVEAFIWGCFEI